jgi:alpha-tubulin suppressor-like RCC1 family protein/uncharacterized protein YjdB
MIRSYPQATPPRGARALLALPALPALPALLALLATLSCSGDLAVDPAGGFSATLEAVAWPDTVLAGQSATFAVRALDREGRQVADLTLEAMSSDTAVLAVLAGAGTDSVRVAARRPGGTTVNVRIDQRPFAPTTLMHDLTVALAGLRTHAPTSDTARFSALADTVVLRANGLDVAGEAVSAAGLVWAATGDAVELFPYADGDSARIVSRAPGTAAIVISHPLCRGECVDTVPLQVHQEAARLAITPSADTLSALGDTLHLAAAVADRNGFPVAGMDSGALTWRSLDPTVVEVVAPGHAVARSNGTARIVAVAGDVADTVQLAVVQRVARVTIGGVPSAPLTALGESATLTAVAYDASDQPVMGAAAAWSSLDAAVASVDATTGRVTAVGNGTARIVAAAAGVADTVQITVAPRAASVKVVPAAGTLRAIGDTLHLSAEVVDARGNAVAGAAVTWHSSNALVATVDQSGLVTATGYGEAWIKAEEAGGVSGEILVSVIQQRVVYEKLAVGSGSSCGLTAEGAAYCWGYNFNGKLGDGVSGATMVSRPVPVAGGLVFQELAIGGYHIVGLTRDGRAYAWGGNANGQLGDGTTTVRRTPVPVAGGLRFVAISAFGSHTLALTADGTLYAWGRNVAGELGDSTTIDRHTPVRVATDLTFSKISAGWEHSIALTADGKAYSWGNALGGRLGTGNVGAFPDPVTAPVPVAGGHTFVEISAGFNHTLGLTSGGQAYGWGSNAYGQVGDGTRMRHAAPVPILSLSNIVSVSAGQDFSVALDAAGNAYAWGHNTRGKLGDGTTIDRQAPVPVVGGHHFISVFAGSTAAGGLTGDGVSYGWGSNLSRQLGDGTEDEYSAVPTPSIILYR